MEGLTELVEATEEEPFILHPCLEQAGCQRVVVVLHEERGHDSV
jgi:hypothetical protein